MPIFEKQLELPVGSEPAFAWHLRDGALERLTPPWERARVLARRGAIAEGGTVLLELRKGPLRLQWEAKHEGFEPGRQFVDRQVRGPFHRWVHTHRVEPTGPGRSRMIDRVEYRLPLGALGQAVAGRSIAGALQRLFRYRHTQLADDLAMHGDFPMQKIAVSGASGLIGQGLCALLSTGGHQLQRLVRRPPGAALAEGEIRWDPERGELDPAALEGLDAVIHLSGANINGRFTEAHKREVRDSRLQSTGLLAKTLAGLSRKPAALICASAVGFYGDRPETASAEHLDERSPRGQGFLAEVCEAWEAAAAPARAAGIRTCAVRVGVVLTPKGGALKELLPPFQLGLGGRIGNGRQGMSWVDYDDVLGAFHHCLVTPTLEGPVNAVAPHPVSNAEFVKALAKVLGRPSFLPLPSAVVRAVFGEMGQALLLEGARVFPTKLEQSGYQFRFRDLEASLRHQLGR